VFNIILTAFSYNLFAEQGMDLDEFFQSTAGWLFDPMLSQV